jgi:hypothetical protein
MSRRHTSRRLGFDALEDRRMMAVTANITGGDLVIRGDGAADQIQITQAVQNNQPIPGQYFIQGLNGTKINGQASLIAVNVNDDFDIDLRGGNDRLVLGNNGASNRTTVPDELRVKMGTGNNKLYIQGITVLGDATLETGSGNDTLSIRGDFGAPSASGDSDSDLTINTGDGNDGVFLDTTSVGHDLDIDTGSSNSADEVGLYLTNVVGKTNIETHRGADRVHLTGGYFNDDLEIDTGDQNDIVSIDAISADEIFVQLGSGNDELSFLDVYADSATLNGQGNSDRLIRKTQGLWQPTVQNFEQVIEVL